MTPQQRAAQTRADRLQLAAIAEEHEELRAGVRRLSDRVGELTGDIELTMRALMRLAEALEEATGIQRPPV